MFTDVKSGDVSAAEQLRYEDSKQELDQFLAPYPYDTWVTSFHKCVYVKTNLDHKCVYIILDDFFTIPF